MKILEKLHKSNADINATDGEMHTLVHWAIVCGHANIVDFLLNQKCNAETPDIHGAYPIHYAAQMCGQIDVWDENILRNPQKSKISKFLYGIIFCLLYSLSVKT